MSESKWKDVTPDRPWTCLNLEYFQCEICQPPSRDKNEAGSWLATLYIKTDLDNYTNFWEGSFPTKEAAQRRSEEVLRAYAACITKVLGV